MSGERVKQEPLGLGFDQAVLNAIAETVSPESRGSRAIAALYRFSGDVAAAFLDPDYYRSLHAMTADTALADKEALKKRRFKNPISPPALVWQFDDLDSNDSNEKPESGSDTGPFQS